MTVYHSRNRAAFKETRDEITEKRIELIRVIQKTKISEKKIESFNPYTTAIISVTKYFMVAPRGHHLGNQTFVHQQFWKFGTHFMTPITCHAVWDSIAWVLYNILQLGLQQSVPFLRCSKIHIHLRKVLKLFIKLFQGHESSSFCLRVKDV